MTGSAGKDAVVASCCVAACWNAEREVVAGDDCAFGCALFCASSSGRLNRRDAEAKERQARGTVVLARRAKLPRKCGPDSGRIVKERCGAGVRACCDRKYSILCRVCQGVFCATAPNFFGSND
jgi:hypothetical protein